MAPTTGSSRGSDPGQTVVGRLVFWSAIVAAVYGLREAAFARNRKPLTSA